MSKYMSKKVKLIPIAMVTPTVECIYAPSKIRPEAEMDKKKFNQVYADHPIPIQVSFDKDGKSNPVLTTTYVMKVKYANGKSMHGRFIIKKS